MTACYDLAEYFDPTREDWQGPVPRAAGWNAPLLLPGCSLNDVPLVEEAISRVA